MNYETKKAAESFLEYLRGFFGRHCPAAREQ